MVISALKIVVFTVIILLAGQIQVGNQRIAEHVHGKAKQLLERTGAQVKESKAFTALAGSSLLQRWVNNVYPPPAPPVAAAAAAPSAEPPPTTAPNAAVDQGPGDAESDTFTSSDRESILRLLN